MAEKGVKLENEMKMDFQREYFKGEIIKKGCEQTFAVK